MSEATLKRKTFAQYNNSGGKGFSLNGTTRNQGWIGQDTISRSFPKTLMKGNVIKGHGGLNGFYPKKSIITSAVTSLNDSSVIKKSVLDTNGMIRTKYSWIWRPQPFSTTKQDTCHTTNSQSSYITTLSANISDIIDSSYSKIMNINNNNSCCINTNLPREARPKPMINPQIIQTRYPGNYVKTNMSRPENNNPIMGILGGGYVNYIMPQSKYISYLNNQCPKKIVDIKINSTCSYKTMPQNLLQTALIGGTRTF